MEPVDSDTSFRLTLGITPPSGSTTVPVMEPVTVCAEIVALQQNSVVTTTAESLKDTPPHFSEPLPRRAATQLNWFIDDALGQPAGCTGHRDRSFARPK